MTILCVEINCFFFESIKNYLFYLKTLIGPRLYRTKCFSWNFELENYLRQVNKKFSSGEYCYSIKTLENDELNDKKFYSILLKSVWLLAHFNVV